MRKVGGLYFWQIGRLGGSIYIKRGEPMSAAKRRELIDALVIINICNIAIWPVALGWII